MSSAGLGHQKSGAAAQKCNLLGEYLKGNGSLGICTTANPEANNKGVTMNLLPTLENNSAEASKQNVGASSSSTSNTIKATDFFPEIIPNLASTNFKKTDAMEHGTSEMTVFYDGKVHVFNNFPADKAKEILALAHQLGSSNNNTSATAAADKINSRRAATPDLNVPSTYESDNHNNVATPHRFPQLAQASLHRFLQKRKARPTARGVNNPSSSSSSSAMGATLNKPDPNY